jgi:hypothetical protein
MNPFLLADKAKQHHELGDKLAQAALALADEARREWARARHDYHRAAEAYKDLARGVRRRKALARRKAGK